MSRKPSYIPYPDPYEASDKAKATIARRWPKVDIDAALDMFNDWIANDKRRDKTIDWDRRFYQSITNLYSWNRGHEIEVKPKPVAAVDRLKSRAQQSGFRDINAGETEAQYERALAVHEEIMRKKIKEHNALIERNNNVTSLISNAMRKL